MHGRLIMLVRELKLYFPMVSLGWYGTHNKTTSANSILFQLVTHEIIISLLMKLQGTLKLCRLAKEVAGSVNVKRKERGLLPRAVSFLDF